MLNHAELDSYRDEYEITIGHDAEVFLRDIEGRSISAIGKVGGSKEKPLKTPHGWVQEDGMAAEVNISPAKSSQEFVQSSLLVLDDLLSIIQPLDLSIDISASTVFDNDQLKHPLATLAGCDPDYNAYSVEENQAVQYEDGLRAGAGHIHIGWKDSDSAGLEGLLSLVKAVDLHVTLPSVLLDPDTRRRSLYGKAGDFRPKPYGIEARSPSNFWLRSTQEMEWVYYAAIKSHLKMGESLGYAMECEVQRIINESDRAGALELVHDLKLDLPVGVEINDL